MYRAHRIAVEQLNPANHASPPNSFREHCLAAEKYKFLSSFSKKQKTWELPHHEQKSRRKSREQDRERTRAVLDSAGCFGKGYKNPLFGHEAEDVLHSDARLSTAAQRSSSSNVCCNVLDANMQSSSDQYSNIQTHGFGLLDTVMSGDALLSSADVDLPSPFAAADVQNSRVARSPEPRFGVASTLSPQPMRRLLSNAGFGDSAEDRKSVEHGRIDGPRHTNPTAGHRSNHTNLLYDRKAPVDVVSRSHGRESSEWFA